MISAQFSTRFDVTKGILLGRLIAEQNESVSIDIRAVATQSLNITLKISFCSLLLAQFRKEGLWIRVSYADKSLRITHENLLNICSALLNKEFLLL